ncbi:MAG: hypothetical protein WD530_07005, partial [Vicingaceae bacterium]
MKIQKLLLFVLIITTIQLNLFAQKDSSDFVFTIKTDNLGVSSDSSYQLQLEDSLNFNVDIDWDNDGIFDTLGVDSTITHKYDSIDSYTIRLRGSFSNLKFGGDSARDRSKLISIDQWGSQVWNTTAYMFSNCDSLLTTPL